MKPLSSAALLLAFLTGVGVFSTAPAEAIPYDYSVTGIISGTFNADLSVPGGSFNSWTLATPTATFTNLTGTVFANTNLVLFQTLGSNLLSFLVVPSSERYVGVYSGRSDAGYFTGSFTQVASVPEPGTISLMIIGLLAIAGARWLPVQRPAVAGR
jgi:hypothetical protein